MAKRKLIRSYRRLSKLERDLRSCMHCKYFYGSSSQCIRKNCVREEIEEEEKLDTQDDCWMCPYKKSEGYCFPCMKKLLGLVSNKDEKEKRK